MIQNGNICFAFSLIPNAMQYNELSRSQHCISATERSSCISHPAQGTTDSSDVHIVSDPKRGVGGDLRIGKSLSVGKTQWKLLQNCTMQAFADARFNESSHHRKALASGQTFKSLKRQIRKYTQTA